MPARRKDGANCAICLEHLSRQRKAVALECAHKFCFDCLKSQQKSGSFTCAICRAGSDLLRNLGDGPTKGRLRKQKASNSAKNRAACTGNNAAKKVRQQKSSSQLAFVLTPCVQCRRRMYGVTKFPCNHKLCSNCMTELCIMLKIVPNEKCPKCMFHLHVNDDDRNNVPGTEGAEQWPAIMTGNNVFGADYGTPLSEMRVWFQVREPQSNLVRHVTSGARQGLLRMTAPAMESERRGGDEWSTF